MSTTIAYLLLLTIVPFVGQIVGSMVGVFFLGRLVDTVIPPDPDNIDVTKRRTHALGALNGISIAVVSSIFAYVTFSLMDVQFSSVSLWVLFGWFLLFNFRRLGMANDRTQPMELGVLFGTSVAMLGIIFGYF